MLNSFIAFHVWEPALWFGVSVVAFFVALACLCLHAAGKG